MPDYTIKQGDTLSKIAKDHKLANWKVIYNHPSNAEFRKLRPDPDLIYPGDVVFVPEQKQKKVPAQTKNKHKYKKRAVTNTLKLVLLDGNHEPLAETDYTLTVAGVSVSGKTDEKGKLEHKIPVDATSGKLSYSGLDIDLKIGWLDPLEKVEGVQARLQNLGYKITSIDGTEGEEYTAAVKAFQTDYGLEVDGIVGPITRGKLKDVYGC